VRLAARLTDVAVTTFTAGPASVRAVLPPDVEPVVVDVDGAGAFGLVSAVSFVLDRVNLWPRLRCGHVDYRAYVRHGDETAVWFLGAAMDSRLAHVLKHGFGMPWHRARVDVSATGDGYRLNVQRDGADATIVAVPDGPVTDELAATLVDPVVGLFEHRGRLRRYEVRHRPLRPEGARANGARVELFERLRLIHPDQRPYSILRIPDFEIDIAFPPRRVRAPRR